MKSPNDELDDLLNEIEKNCDPSVECKECCAFMVECLWLIRDKLPPIALEAMAVLQRYLAEPDTLDTVTDILAKCWGYIDENYNGIDCSTPEVSAIRAVIFPLDAQRRAYERDIVDYLSSFLKFVNQVEPHRIDEEALLRKHFAKCV